MAKKKEELEKVEEVVQEPTSLIHIDEYLHSKGDIRPEVKAGFKVFMRGRAYQSSFHDFDKELGKYFNRKI